MKVEIYPLGARWIVHFTCWKSNLSPCGYISTFTLINSKYLHMNKRSILIIAINHLLTCPNKSTSLLITKTFSLASKFGFSTQLYFKIKDTTSAVNISSTHRGRSEFPDLHYCCKMGLSAKEYSTKWDGYLNSCWQFKQKCTHKKSVYSKLI